MIITASTIAVTCLSLKFQTLFQTPWHPRIQMPLEAAVVYFMIGTCCTELNNHNGALDAFNNAIKVNPDYAEVSQCLLPCIHVHLFVKIITLS